MGEPGHGSATAGCKGLRVLVTSDEQDSAPLFTRLCAVGCNVRVAADDASTLRQAIAFRPDLVLLDLGLPRLDAFGVARAMRRHVALAETRLIAVTAFSDDFYGLRHAGAAFHRYLKKPYDWDALAQLVTSFASVSQYSAAE